MFLIFSEGQLKWMSDALVPVMHNLRSTITVEIRLFTTAAAVEKDPFSLDSPIEDKSLSLPIAQGRPDIRSLINNEIANATGDIAVNGMLLYCTPSKSADNGSSVWDGRACKERQRCITQSSFHGYP